MRIGLSPHSGVIVLESSSHSATRYYLPSQQLFRRTCTFAACDALPFVGKVLMPKPSRMDHPKVCFQDNPMSFLWLQDDPRERCGRLGSRYDVLIYRVACLPWFAGTRLTACRSAIVSNVQQTAHYSFFQFPKGDNLSPGELSSKGGKIQGR